MHYKIESNKSGTFTVTQNNVPVEGAYVKRVEFEEDYFEGPNGRTYYLVKDSAKVTIRLKDGSEVSNIPFTN